MTNAQKEQKFALTVKVWGLEQWGVSYLWRRLLFPKVFLFSSASSAAPEAPPTFTISRKTTPLEESLPFAQTLRLFYYLLLLPLLLLSNFAVVFFWLPCLFATQPPCCRLAFAPTYAPGAKLAVKMLKMRISVIYQLGRPRLPSPIVVFLPLQRVLLF